MPPMCIPENARPIANGRGTSREPPPQTCNRRAYQPARQMLSLREIREWNGGPDLLDPKASFPESQLPNSPTDSNAKTHVNFLKTIGFIFLDYVLFIILTVTIIPAITYAIPRAQVQDTLSRARTIHAQRSSAVEKSSAVTAPTRKLFAFAKLFKTFHVCSPHEQIPRSTTSRRLDLAMSTMFIIVVMLSAAVDMARKDDSRGLMTCVIIVFYSILIGTNYAYTEIVEDQQVRFAGKQHEIKEYKAKYEEMERYIEALESDNVRRARVVRDLCAAVNSMKKEIERLKQEAREKEREREEWMTC